MEKRPGALLTRHFVLIEINVYIINKKCPWGFSPVVR